MNLLVTAALLFMLQNQQQGRTPREVSPELARQMRREALTGISAADAEEHRKMREALAELLRRIQSGERKRSDLERYVGSLDISVDTRLLVEAMADIKELKRAQKAAEDESRAERESARGMIASVKSGFLLLILGYVVNKIIALWQARRDKETRATRHDSVMGALGDVQSEARAAFTEANNVNAKIASLGMQIRDEPKDGQ